jgi:4-amino-4-deoxy-L-arabinose transferase-like glycosyltransferase
VDRSLARVLVLLAVLAVMVGIDNLERPLANPDEGRYSEISREMAASGDWVTPRLNGLKYFEKPPLQYWATAAAFRLFGESEYTARLYTGFCGLLVVLAVFLTMRRIASGDAALLAAGVLLSSPYFIALGGIVTLDMGLTAWLTLGACAFLYAQAEALPPATRRRAMWVAWAAVALAVLSKGLVGIVFPAAAIFLHCLVHRDWALLRRLEWAPGIAIFLAIAAPWFVMVQRANPEFAHFFFVHEHFERFLTTEHRRQEPWWYFVPIVFGGVLPWMFALVPAVVSGWRLEAARGAFPWRRFAILWSSFILVFFSASGSKLPAYVLPMFPLLAFLVGDWLLRTEPRRIARYLAPVAIVIVVALALAWGAPERARTPWMRELYAAARFAIVSGGVILAAGLAVAAFELRKGLRTMPLALVIACTLIFIERLEDGYEALSPRQSGIGIAAVMAPHLTPATRVYSVNFYDQTLPFYLKREVILADYVDEFQLGQRSEPQRSLKDVAAFVAAWRQPGPALALMQPGLYEKLAGEGVSFRLLHQDERRAVVTKP